MVVHVDVKPFPDEPIDRLVKRFVKKCKKEEIVRVYCEGQTFKTKRQKQREKSLRHQRSMKRKEVKLARKQVIS